MTHFALLPEVGFVQKFENQYPWQGFAFSKTMQGKYHFGLRVCMDTMHDRKLILHVYDSLCLPSQPSKIRHKVGTPGVKLGEDINSWTSSTGINWKVATAMIHFHDLPTPQTISAIFQDFGRISHFPRLSSRACFPSIFHNHGNPA